MDNEINMFLDQLKKTSFHLVQYAEQWDNESYKVVLKIINGEDISDKEMQKITEDCCIQFYPASILMKSPNTPNEIKKIIVDNIINGKLQDRNRYNSLINNALNNYADISIPQIDALFQKHFFKCLRVIKDFKSTRENMSPYCEKVTNEFTKLFLKVLNNQIPMPYDFDLKYSPIHCVKSPVMFVYINDHMPQDVELAKFVSSQLINNPRVPENKKNELFDIYGYNFLNKTRFYLTPYMSEQLYSSMIESFCDFTNNGQGNNYKVISGKFLENAITTNTLPETIQLDLVKRMLSEKNSKTKNILSNIAEHTSSANVLHLILEQASYVNIRDKTCRNKYISDDDLQKQADIYCKKIKNALKKENPQIACKWISEVVNVLSKKTIKDDQYKVLLSLGDFNTLSHLICKITTPPHIVIEATKLVEEEYKKTRFDVWNTLLIQAKLHTELINKNCNNQKQLTFALSCFENSFNEYNKVKHLNYGFCLRDSEVMCENNDFYNQVIDIYEKVLGSEYQDYLNKLKKYLYKAFKAPIVQKHLQINNLNEVDIREIKHRIDLNINSFDNKIRDNNSFSVIAEYAHRHTIFSDAIEQQEKEFNTQTK
jgi:hypothetical protein